MYSFEAMSFFTNLLLKTTKDCKYIISVRLIVMIICVMSFFEVNDILAAMYIDDFHTVLADNLIILNVNKAATKVKIAKETLPKITNSNHACERNTCYI